MTAQSRAASRSLATVSDAPSTVTAKTPVPQLIVKKEDGQKVAIHTAILLNRNPILTRTPTAFENAYYAYQARIDRALHNPLPYDFYFKPGTQLELQFDKEEEERERAAFGKSATPSPRVKTEEELRASDEDNAEMAALESQQQEEEFKPLPREHESDRTGDVKSLDRQGQRNVYLLVQVKDEAGKAGWRFPHAPVNTRENLFEVRFCLLLLLLVADVLTECPKLPQISVRHWNGHLGSEPQPHWRPPRTISSKVHRKGAGMSPTVFL